MWELKVELRWSKDASFLNQEVGVITLRVPFPEKGQVDWRVKPWKEQITVVETAEEACEETPENEKINEE